MLLRPLYWDLGPFLAWQRSNNIWFSCFHWLLICKMIYKYTPHRTVYSSSRTSCKPLEVNREFFSVALIKHLIDFVIFLKAIKGFLIQHIVNIWTMLTAVSLHLYCLVADDCLNELNNFFSTAFVRVLWLGHICHSTLVHGLNVCVCYISS